MNITDFYAYLDGPVPQDAAGRHFHEIMTSLRQITGAAQNPVINGCDLWNDPIGSCLGSWSGWTG